MTSMEERQRSEYETAHPKRFYMNWEKMKKVAIESIVIGATVAAVYVLLHNILGVF